MRIKHIHSKAQWAYTSLYANKDACAIIQVLLSMNNRIKITIKIYHTELEYNNNTSTHTHQTHGIDMQDCK